MLPRHEPFGMEAANNRVDRSTRESSRPWPRWVAFLSRLIGSLLLLSGSWISSVAAADAKSLIREAFDKTGNAATVADYNTIIELCGQAQKAGLDQSQESYVKSLLSWAHNRRGEVYTEQASAAQQRGDTNQAAQLDGRAFADFEAAIQFDGGRWKSYHNRGVSHAIAGKYQEAIRDFSKAIELNGNYANAWFNRGEIHFDLNQITEAVRDYTEAIRLNPKDAGAYTSRGHTYFRMEKFNEALADYDQAIKLAPSDANALANRGDACQSLGQWQQAAADLKRAIDLGPDSPRVLQSAAWLMATCPEAGIRNPKLAVEAAEKALELSGEPDARLLDTLAAAYANDGRYKDAVAKIKDALRLVSGDELVPLQRRLDLYQKQQPYRQGQASKSAAAPSKPKTR